MHPRAQRFFEARIDGTEWHDVNSDETDDHQRNHATDRPAHRADAITLVAPDGLLCFGVVTCRRITFLLLRQFFQPRHLSRALMLLGLFFGTRFFFGLGAGGALDLEHFLGFAPFRR